MDGERLHTITGALQADGVFRRLNGIERLGQPFLFDVEVLSRKEDISPYDVVGTKMSVSVKLKSGESRHFHGIVTAFLNAGPLGGYQLYKIELRPWLWLLSHTLDCRIFQSKSVPQILEIIFSEKHKYSDFRNDCQASYKPREYCVQYRESDFDFVNRLMEQEGIYYYFEHEASKHTLVLADASTAHKKIAGDGSILFRPPNEVAAGDEHVFDWQHHVEVQSGMLRLRDFDYEKPSAELEVRLTSDGEQAIKSLEQYAYPGEYLVKADGERYLKIQSEGLKSKSARVQGRANSYAMRTGLLFKLMEHTREKENGEYLIIAATTTVTSGEIEQYSPDSENRIEIDFSAIPKNRTYRSPRTTINPIIAGPQTAIVVGKQGQEIWTDSFGRVKVQFFWDRFGKKDESSSCWIRVAQVWSGKGWGSIHIPRIGQEVIVEFLEGDPDRPLITGRVYNAEQTTPYSLPDMGSQSGLKSRSTPAGDSQNFNELRFEDKKDKEEIYFHAERDFKRVVENNDVLEIGMVKKSDGNQTIEVWKNRNETIHTGDRIGEVKKGNDQLTITAGNQKISIPVGQCEVTAGKKIVLKVGASSITIEPSKIVIQSPQIAITADMKAEVSASMTNISGSAVLKLEGGIIKIN